jgi:hypothetical protein
VWGAFGFVVHFPVTRWLRLCHAAVRSLRSRKATAAGCIGLTSRGAMASACRHRCAATPESARTPRVDRLAKHNPPAQFDATVCAKTNRTSSRNNTAIN